MSERDLVHCDYSVDSNITIELRKDCYIFSNPGSLLLPISKYYQGGNSVCRNKALQTMFMLLGSAEKAGSGADKIMQGWQSANSLFGEEITSIDHDKLMTLAICCSEGYITNYRLQLVLNKHSADITKLLKELCGHKYLISFGIGRGTRYKINTEYSKVASKGASKVASKCASKVASRKRKKAIRLNKDDLYQEITSTCPDYASLEDIASAVGKTLSYLKNKIIPRMVEQGMLERKYPENPRHPRQQYRAMDKKL